MKPSYVEDEMLGEDNNTMFILKKVADILRELRRQEGQLGLYGLLLFRIWHVDIVPLMVSFFIGLLFTEEH